MSRLAHIIMNAVTVASLSVFVVAVVLWVRNFWVVETAQWNGARWFASLSTSDCTLELWILPRHIGDREPGWNCGSGPNERFFDYFWGMAEMRTDGQLKVAAPYWLLGAVSAFADIVCIAGRRIRRRQQTGHGCRVCGYDLRATPGRCPECGSIPAR